MPKHKSTWATGLEVVLNNKDASFMNNPKVFGELSKESQMPISHMIMHLGKTKKNQRNNKPTDEERSKARLDAVVP